jgi:transposase
MEAETTTIWTYIGIDISKSRLEQAGAGWSRLDVAVRPAGAGKTTQAFSQANNPAGIRALIKQLKAMQPRPQPQPRPRLIVLEPSGGYEQAVAIWLTPPPSPASKPRSRVCAPSSATSSNCFKT